MHKRGTALVAVLALTATSPALAGHTLGHYPSYYPDEIVVDTLDPVAAAKGLASETLHAYVGAAPAFEGPMPAHVRPLASLASFLVLDFDPASPAFASPERRCASARAITAALGNAKVPGFAFHPYPVTPYHPDYIHHADRAEAAAAATRGETSGAPGAKVIAKGKMAQAIAAERLAGAADGFTVRLEEVPVAGFSLGTAVQLDGWLGPPWMKLGWFQAYRLLASALDPEPRRQADEIYDRLIHGEVTGLAEEAELERELVAALMDGCRRMVVGYAVRQEYLNEATSAGIENVAYDSQAGLNAPVFLRTAKLKDFPWNGRLRLGLREGPRAAWNPVAGFTDAAGRLIWSALGDPAMFPIPYSAGWVPNRAQFEITVVRGQSGGIRLPDGVFAPEPGTGALRPAGAQAFASGKATYDVVGSPYLDGTEMEMADVLYPYSFASRWGAAAEPGGTPREPVLAEAFATMQERLVGLRPLRVKHSFQNIAEEFDVAHTTPVIEVYLKDAPGTDDQIAALAPPWSAVPWHLLALMEAAVDRSYAAFSETAALRRGVPWMDLARDPALKHKLLALCQEFERSGFRPAGLEPFVTAEAAARRWRALKAFAEENGYFLVTNGPYRLRSWTADSVVLAAVREATYPLGFGTFDHMADPPRAVIRDVSLESGAIMVQADADLTVKIMRRHETRREPLTRHTAHGLRGVLVASRYLLIGPDGRVVAAGKMSWEPDNRFKIALPDNLPSGRYAAAVGVFLDGNEVLPSIRIFGFEAGGKN